MSSVARRERKYGGESDRTKRVVYQPVQAWEKKWVESARGSAYQVCKWVKSDKEIEFEDDDEEEEEEEEEVMDTEKEPTAASELEPSSATTSNVPQSEKVENKTEETPDLPVSTGILGNAVDQKIVQIEEEEQTHTPKLDDVSDHEPEPQESTDADRDNPAAYPAFNPHKQAQLLETDSLDTTPQGTQDEEMEDTSGLDPFQSNTATPDYADYRADRAREVLDTNMSEGTSMEPSLSRSSINDDTPASSGEFDQ